MGPRATRLIRLSPLLVLCVRLIPESGTTLKSIAPPSCTRAGSDSGFWRTGIKCQVAEVGTLKLRGDETEQETTHLRLLLRPLSLSYHLLASDTHTHTHTQRERGTEGLRAGITVPLVTPCAHWSGSGSNLNTVWCEGLA